MIVQDLLSQKNVFDLHINRGPRPLSSYHFAAIFGWQDFFEFSFEIIDERLCVFAGQHGDKFLYLPPLGGDIKSSTLKSCFTRMGPGNTIARVENISNNSLPTLKGPAYNTYLKTHEYLYRRKDLEGLAGHAYKSKRHDIHVFERRFPKAHFRAFVLSDLKACADAHQRWADNRGSQYRDPVYLAMLEDSARMHMLLMEHAAELGLLGRVVEIGGEIAAYTFGYALNENTFCVCLEVTDLNKAGLAAYIFNSLCADKDVRPFEFINTMDDFAMPQLAKAKNSYHPVEHQPVYTLRLTA